MFTHTKLRFASYGEVLFDVFGTQKKIGGAPLNIALRIKSYQFPVAMISAVGTDENGTELWNYMYDKGINLRAVNRLEQYPTGVVNVTLGAQGSPSYDIQFPAAWDFIPHTAELDDLLEEIDVLIYGSLASRNATSRATLEQLLSHEKHSKMYKVFDVNLRAPYYQFPLLRGLMDKADFIKFNDDEIYEIVEAMGLKITSLEHAMRWIADQTKSKTICVTRGAHGAVLLWEDEFYYNEGYHVQVADTVGAGDSFLGTLLCKLLVDQDPQKALDMACAVGSLVASASGANPTVNSADILHMMNANK